MAKECKIARRFQYITYIITTVFTILSIILSRIDKGETDAFIIVDIVLGSLLILSLTFSITLLNKDLLEIFLGVNGVLWMANNILGFFTYINPKDKDYLGICIFLRVFRILSVFSCMAFITIKIDEEEDY